MKRAQDFGMEVPLALLQAIADLPEEALHRGLVQLQAAEFLYETRLFPEHAYTFKHALTHEVAYRSLLRERRRTLHTRIVEALEALAGDRPADQVERLADHAVRGEVWDKALVYCRQAGAKAMERSASREAVGCYEQALAALAHLPEHRALREQAIDVRCDLCIACMVLGQHERALHDLHEAETLAEALDDPRRLGRVSLHLAQYFLSVGQYDPAIASSQRALTLAAASGDSGTPILASTYLGMTYYFQGDYRQAIDGCRRAMAALEGERRYERFGQPVFPAVTSRAFLSICLAEVGAFAEGIAVGEAALHIAETVSIPLSLVVGYRSVGHPYLRQGNLHQALPVLERAVGLCEEADLPFQFSLLAPYLGTAYLLCGRVDDAVRLLERALEQVTSSSTMPMGTPCSSPLWARRIYALAVWRRRIPSPPMPLRISVLTRNAVVRRIPCASSVRLPHIVLPRRSQQADASYRQALALAEELGMRPLQAHCHRGLGTLYATTGQRDQARAALATAIEMYRGMEMTFWLPETEAALAQLDV